jgi:hypothetical protein
MIKKFDQYNKVICTKCDWNWYIESDDKRPYFCHRCGYDNKLNKYDIPALKKWQKENNNPFKEYIKEDYIIREFNSNVDESLLVWHRDYQDRLISVIDETNWKIQLENKLPEIIKEDIFIPKGVYHRIIKGKGDLKIKVKFK